MQTPPHVYAVCIILSFAILITLLSLTLLSLTLLSLETPDFKCAIFSESKKVGRAYLARGTCAFIRLLAHIRNLHIESLKIPKFH